MKHHLRLAMVALLLCSGAIMVTTAMERKRVHAPSLPYDYCQANFPSTFQYPPPLSDSTLQMVQIITRHGDRAPCNILPYENVQWDCPPVDYATASNPRGSVLTSEQSIIPPQSVSSPWSNTIWSGTCADGQLTPKGFAMQVQLGSQLRALYGKLGLISDDNTIAASQISVRATTVPRARQSAEGFIAGFFNNTRTPAPPLIPITTVPTNLDVLQAVRNRCPALDKIKDDLVASSGWQQHLAQASSLKQQLDGICGTGGQAGWAVSYDHFFDNFRARTCHNKPLPCSQSTGECVTPQQAAQVFAMGNWETQYQYLGYQTDRRARLEAGPMLDLILGPLRALSERHATAKATGQTAVMSGDHGHIAPKLYLYSAHDGTVSPLLASLLQWPNATSGWIWPPYASQIIIETWLKQGQLGVRVLYNNEQLPLKSCGGQLWCLASSWLPQVKHDYIPDDVIKECNQQTPTPSATNDIKGDKSNNKK